MGGLNDPLMGSMGDHLMGQGNINTSHMNQPHTNEFNNSNRINQGSSNLNDMMGQNVSVMCQNIPGMGQNPPSSNGDNRRLGLHRQGSMGQGPISGSGGFMGANNSLGQGGMGPISAPMDQSGIMGPALNGSWPMNGMMGRTETHGSSKWVSQC